jgi:hypothetical protein
MSLDNLLIDATKQGEPKPDARYWYDHTDVWIVGEGLKTRKTRRGRVVHQVRLNEKGRYFFKFVNPLPDEVDKECTTAYAWSFIEVTEENGKKYQALNQLRTHIRKLERQRDLLHGGLTLESK